MPILSKGRRQVGQLVTWARRNLKDYEGSKDELKELLIKVARERSGSRRYKDVWGGTHRSTWGRAANDAIGKLRWFREKGKW